MKPSKPLSGWRVLSFSGFASQCGHISPSSILPLHPAVYHDTAVAEEARKMHNGVMGTKKLWVNTLVKPMTRSSSNEQSCLVCAINMRHLADFVL